MTRMVIIRRPLVMGKVTHEEGDESGFGSEFRCWCFCSALQRSVRRFSAWGVGGLQPADEVICGSPQRPTSSKRDEELACASLTRNRGFDGLLKYDQNDCVWYGIERSAHVLSFF